MSNLQIFLFGKFQAQGEEQAPIRFESRKVQELFCYLLLYRDRPHPREILADLLWGDCTTAQAKGYLRKTLWQLQTDLEAQAGLYTRDLLLVEPEWIQLNPATGFWLDVARFEQAFHLAQGVPGKELPPEHSQILSSAVELYRGDLLEGWYCDWSLYERERLQHMYLGMLDKLMDYCASQQTYEVGITYGMQALRFDRARERTHRRLMRLQYLAGDRTAALYQFTRCATALAEELGVKPAQRTVTLYEQIQKDQLETSDPPPAAASLLPEMSPDFLFRPLEYLKQFEATLTDLQRRIQQEIEAVELALKQRR